MEGLTVEQRDVQQEALLRGPAGDDLGEHGGEGDGRRHAVAVRDLVQLRLRLGREPVIQTDAARGIATLVLGNHRQRGNFGQIRETLLPPVASGRVVGGGALLTFEVFGEGVADRIVRFGIGVVERGQIVEDATVALRVTGEHIDIDVHPVRAVGQRGKGDVDDLADLDIHALVTLLVAQPLQLGGRIGGGGQVHGAKYRVQRLGQYPLRTTVGELHPQLRMAAHQPRDRACHSLGFQSVAVEFDVEVGGDPAELLILAATDPVGVLHGGQREFLAVGNGPSRLGGHLGFGFGRAQQLRPRGDCRLQRELGAADLVALLTPATRQTHQHHRVHAEAHQVVVVADGFRFEFQLCRHDIANVRLAEHQTKLLTGLKNRA